MLSDIIKILTYYVWCHDLDFDDVIIKLKLYICYVCMQIQVYILNIIYLYDFYLLEEFLLTYQFFFLFNDIDIKPIGTIIQKKKIW
jgi:hypothetical protein